MILVQLTTKSDKKIVVNPARISYFGPAEEDAETQVVVDGHLLLVKEPFLAVKESIEQAGFSIWERSLGF